MADSRRQRIALRTGLGAWLALALWQLLWHGWWQPATHGPAMAVAVAATLPLLLPALALRRPLRALLLAGMLALFYFAHGVADAWSDPATRVPALVEVGLSLLLIGALGAGVERRGRRATAAPEGR